GAVGQYYITAAPGPTQLTTDDDFSLRVEIQGNGDSRRWDPPAPHIDGNFELYDPRIIEDIFNESAGNIVHSRTIEYMMIPQTPGEFQVFLPFTFFNPVSKNYETVRSDTSELQVGQGNSLTKRAATDTIQLIPPNPGIVTNTLIEDRFWTSPPHLILYGLNCSGLLFGLFVKVKRNRDSQIPESEKLRSAAGIHARQQLDFLQKIPSHVSDKGFFEKATEIYYKFLSEKFSISPADLDKEKLHGYLVKANVADTTIQRALRFFEQCLSVRYGGIPGGYSRDEMISETKQIIDLLGS
ncbi:MAG: BatD family protein, partial [Saprospiraceae bacterium]